MLKMHNKIQFLCDQKGIKVAQLCKEAGIPKSTISDLKNGRTKTLSTQTLKKIANYFNVSLDYFDSSNDLIDIKKDELFEKRKLLFDMSKKANEEQLDAVISVVKSIVGNNN